MTNNYLLIGGNGVIGHFVARRLVDQGHRPVLFSRGGDTTLVADIADRCETVRGDMTDAGSVDRAIRDHAITHVVHLGAALPSVTEVDPAAAVRLNMEGTANVLQASRANGVSRVVMASTKAVYGAVAGEYAAPVYRPVPETMAHPTSMYGITKHACEMMASWFRREHGLECVTLRFAATVGPGKIARHGGTYSRYSVIIENGMAGRPLNITRGADEACDMLFNDEAARGILCALHAARPAHDVYNIASGTGFTLRQLAAAVERRFPQARFDFATPSAPSGSGNFVLDPTLARDELGFTADADLDRIVAAYVDTMQRLGLQPDVAPA